MKCFTRCLYLAAIQSSLIATAQIDLNSNQQSDIWERNYAARDLLPNGDADGDGRSNRDESIAGTDPFDPQSYLKIDFGLSETGGIRLSCPVANPKRYNIYHRDDLSAGDWMLLESVTTYDPFEFSEAIEGDRGFYKVEVLDADSDGDGLTDWEELKLGFNPALVNTDYYRDDDFERITDALGESNLISLHLLDTDTYENWPDPATFVIRRSGGIDPINVSFSYSGSASPADYSGPTTTLSLPAGQNDTYLQIFPVDDGLDEGTETLTLTLLDGADYDLGASNSGSIQIHDANDGLSPKEAGRLLAQATFGATEPDIASVQSLGIEGWIDAQMALPPSLLQTATEAAYAIDGADPDINFYGSGKLVGWWNNAIRADDQLRQRVAFALSEILVVSDDTGMIDGEPIGMANYYDIFVRHAFGNYRDIIEEVTYHPVMGIYLSHKGNRAPDPSIGRFPDENYAREIMQLFTIGLWELNNDGTRKLDASNEPIPTYTNFEISELARVFTGMNWGTNNPLIWWEYSTYPYESVTDPYTVPMQFWEGRELAEEGWLPYRQWIDGEHIEYYMRDHGEKHLANGVVVPAGQSGTEDVALALDGLFNHPNVGPFIGRRLIQRLVKSNPSPAYIDRVASAFNDDGTGTRGNMGAVIKAVLMDPEARDFDELSRPTAGKQREPYLRLVNLGRTFNATSTAGPLVVFWNEDVFQQMPMSAPTVFNFFTPDYAPPGELQNQALFAPEFQITTTVSAMTVPNEFYWITRYRHLSWYNEDYRPYMDYSELLSMADEPDALIRHLDRLLTYGTLSPVQQSIIRHAVQRRIVQNRSDNDIVALAVYLVVTSPDFVIQK